MLVVAVGSVVVGLTMVFRFRNAKNNVGSEMKMELAMAKMALKFLQLVL